MPPSDFLSDLDDLSELSDEKLSGRWVLLSDMHGAFQGAYLVYAILAVALPGGLVMCAILEWTKYPILMLFGAAILFGAFSAVSLYSWTWYRWVRARLLRVEAARGFAFKH